MKKLIMAVAMLILAGCGDTINSPIISSQPENVSHRLLIKDAWFRIYSTITPFRDYGYGVITPRSAIYRTQGFINYSGDIQGVSLQIEPENFGLIYFPLTNLMAGKILKFDLGIPQSDVNIFLYLQFYCTLTDPHGNDSNTFPITLMH